MQKTWWYEVRLIASSIACITGLLFLGAATCLLLYFALDRESGSLEEYQERDRRILYAARERIQREPTNAVAYEKLGNLLSQTDPASSERAFKTAIRLAPDRAEAHAGLGVRYINRGRYDEAEREFRTAIQLAPQNVVYYDWLAHACEDNGKLEEAVNALQRAIQIRPRHDLYDRLSKVYSALGRHAEAQESGSRRGRARDKGMGI